MLTKIISTKLAGAESRLDSAVDSAFFNDIEVKIILRCTESIKNNSVRSTKNSPASWCKKSESKGAEVPPADFLLEAEKRGSPPKSEKRQLLARRGSVEGGAALLREKTSKNNSKEGTETDEITITFFALENDLEYLIKGYLSVFDLKADLVRENNIFYANLPLSKEAILTRLSQKDFIQSCEQISLNDKKILRDSVIMPFNGSRAKITNEFLEANRAFFAESCVDSADLDSAFYARIITQDAESSFMQSYDTNPKNAIYKTIGKALKKSNSLLDSAIFLNFCIDIECLKILLLQKCTFIITRGKPTFSAVRFAQKFGATLIAFTNNDFLILTHNLRFKS